MKEAKLTALASRILALTDSNRELQLGLAQHDDLNRSLEIKGKKTDLLLEESRQLQNHLQRITRQVLDAQEHRHHTMSLRLQDEIVQTLEGLHIRLLVLNKEVSASSEVFQKEIALTKELVQKSVEVINSFILEGDAEHEN